MSVEFRPYGQVFKSKVTGFEVAISDTDSPLFVANLQLLEQADDPTSLKDGTFTVMEAPVEAIATVMVTEKQLEKYNEGAGLLFSFMKAIGFKNFSPLEVLEGDKLPDVSGRTVLVAGNDLPDDFVDGDTLPEPTYRLMWAVGSGKYKQADSETRRRLADALRKKPSESVQKEEPKNDPVPF